MESAIPTSCVSLDKLLGGGLPKGVVSLVYGGAETGKTTFAIQCAVNCTRANRRAIFIDADGAFSSTRLSQIAHHNSRGFSPFLILFRPTTFQEQTSLIDQLEKYLTAKTELVIVDTITSLYRVELGVSPEETFRSNRRLNAQLAYLAQIAKTQKIAVLITSQVRSILTGQKSNVEPVATRVLKFWSDIVLEFKRTIRTQVIKATLEKNPRQKSRLDHFLMIDQTGIRDFSR